VDSSSRSVLHVLPHPGGGAETYVDGLEGLPGYSHRRVALSVTRGRLRGSASVLRRRRRILALAREADVVHVHGDMAAMLVAPALRGAALVITGQGLHRLRRTDGVPGWLLRRRLTQAVGASVRTILSAEDERDDLAAALPAALHERLVVIHNGVPVPPPPDPERRTRLRRELGVADAEVAALFVGRLEPRKDPLGAIAAVEAARAGGAELALLIAGDGPLEEEVRARAGSGIHALGHREDVEDLYTAADLFVLPSRREGMSLALIEAMAHGLVPLVAAGSGSDEAVADAGIVVAGGDVEALAAALARLAADGDERQRLGAAARARLESELSVERFRERTAAQYETALAAAAQGA